MSKFTKEQAFEKIKALLGANKQISDRSINESLETLIKFAGEETELDDFANLILPTFKTMEGQIRNEVAEKSKEIELKKQKTPEQLEAERKAAEEAAKKKEPEGGEPEWFKAYREKQEADLKALQDKLSGQEAAKTIEQRKSDVLSKLKDKYPEQVLKNAQRNFDWSKDTAEQDLDAVCVEVAADFGVKPLSGGGGGGDKTDAAYFAERKKEMIAKGVIKQESN